ncbi:MAG: hypothetical protein CMA67_03890 [Euryarchaeota archaeon]|nr:hypothetical protein [Euryarchaeota archaeon]
MSKGQVGAEQRLVTPGMVIGPATGKRAGSGTIAENNEFIATRLGWLNERNDVVSVLPINSAYMPRSGDLIIGYVAEVRNNLWFFDVNGPFQALLPMSLAPWKVEYGSTRQHLGIGDAALARIQEVDETHNMVLTMKGVGLRRLNEGAVVSIPVNLVDTLRGENNATLSRIRDVTNCRIIVGDNGRVWIHGDAEDMLASRQLIQTLQQEGHKNTFETAVLALENERGEH